VVRGDDLETGPKIGPAIVDVDLVGAGGAYTASTTSAGPSAPVVQVNNLMVSVKPARRTMEVGKLTIRLAMESAHTPST
jgi:hypothetical protein